MIEQAPDLDEGGEFEDFDQWRNSQRAKRGAGKRVRVFGHVITMPTSLPLGLTLEIERVSSSSDLDDVKTVVGALYGADALEHWAAEGCDLNEFQILLAYGMSHANGKKVTFDEAARMVAEANAREAERAVGKGQKKKRKKRGPGGGSPATGR